MLPPPVGCQSQQGVNGGGPPTGENERVRETREKTARQCSDQATNFILLSKAYIAWEGEEAGRREGVQYEPYMQVKGDMQVVRVLC